MTSVVQKTPIGLSELIYQVKRELLESENLSADPVPLFAVDEVHLEIGVTVTRSGKGGLNLQVADLGVTASQAHGHVVRVTLRPLLTRDEVVADLRNRKPELFQRVIQASNELLKGVHDDDSNEDSTPGG